MTKKASRVTEEQKRVWGGLPPAVKVGPGVWSFQFVEGLKHGDDEAFGTTHSLKCEIFLEVNQCYGQARDTVLHELQHAIYSNTIISDDNNQLDEEATIRTTTPWLLMLLKDNPELVAWLTKDETEGEER